MDWIMEWISNIWYVIINFFQKLMITINPAISIWINPDILFLIWITSIIIWLILVYYKKNTENTEFIYNKQKVIQLIFGIVIILWINFLVYNALDTLKWQNLTFLNIKWIQLGDNSNYDLSKTEDIKSLQIDIQDKLQQWMMWVVDDKTPLLFKDEEEYKDWRTKYMYYKLYLNNNIKFNISSSLQPIQIIYYNWNSLKSMTLNALFNKNQIIANYLNNSKKNWIVWKVKSYNSNYTIKKWNISSPAIWLFTINKNILNDVVIWNINEKTIKDILILWLDTDWYNIEWGNAPPFIIKIDNNIIMSPFMVYSILDNPNIWQTLLDEYNINNLAFLNLKFNHSIKWKIYDWVDNVKYVPNNYNWISLNPFLNEVVKNYDRAFGMNVNKETADKISHSIDANSLNLITFIVIFIVLVIIFVIWLIVLNISWVDNIAKIFWILWLFLLWFLIASKLIVWFMSLFLYVFVFQFNIFFINKIIEDGE